MRFCRFGSCTIGFFVLLDFPSWFPPHKVISNHDGIAVQHYALQTAIGTNGYAYLFPQVRENEIEGAGKQNHCQEAFPVQGNGFCSNLDHFVDTDDVGQKSVGHQYRDQKKDKLLGNLFDSLFGSPGSVVEAALSIGVSFDRIFNLPEDHFHKNGLRANPAAKEAPPHYGE